MSEPQAFHMYKMTPEATPFERKSDEAAGYDMYSAVDISIPPGERKVIYTKIKAAIPYGYYGRIADRSSVAVKNGVHVFAGVIDSDYRGEIMVCLYNSNSKEFAIKKGDRISQLILEKIILPQVVVVDDENDLGDTNRGDGGFGSTGV
tara:strand:+ start:1069 stop:1512 length:444 start_codon:yes stop_codon:yes gene_type:complete